MKSTMAGPPGIPTIDPNIVGAPPERHAARVVAAMARWLLGHHAMLDADIWAALMRSRSRFGSPKAQERLAARLLKAGMLDAKVETGKRGKFTLVLIDWHLFDPVRNEAVESKPTVRRRNGRIIKVESVQYDPVPERPWLECAAIMMPFDPRNKDLESTRLRLFVVSHHAMQRLAQRCSARAPLDLISAMRELYCAYREQVIAKDEQPDARRIRYFPVAGGIAVLQWDEARNTSVVVTVLEPGMKLPE